MAEPALQRTGETEPLGEVKAGGGGERHEGEERRGVAGFPATPQAWRYATQYVRSANRVCSEQAAESMPGCGWRDSNPHGLAPRALRTHRVYQFRHTRTAIRQSAAIGCCDATRQRTMPLAGKSVWRWADHRLTQVLQMGSEKCGTSCRVREALVEGMVDSAPPTMTTGRQSAPACRYLLRAGQPMPAGDHAPYGRATASSRLTVADITRVVLRLLVNTSVRPSGVQCTLPSKASVVVVRRRVTPCGNDTVIRLM